MSAAPVLPQPTSIRSACFTPLSFFERVLDMDNFTALRCFCLIMAETLGARPRRPSAEIEDQQFIDACQVSLEWINSALKFLDEAKLIQIAEGRRRTFSIRPEYIAEVEKAGKEAVKGRCPDCKTIGLFESQFIPVPPQALKRMGACVDSATFRAVMVVIRHTLSWDPKLRCIKSTPHELSLHDFTSRTGLEDREMINGLNQAKQLGLIGHEKRKGKPGIFWAIPEALAGLKPRDLRTVTPREGGDENREKPEPTKIVTIPSKSEESSANESAPYFFGRCPNCRHFVDVEPITEEDFIAAQPEKPPRAGPQRAKASTGDRNDAAWDVLRRAYAGPKTIVRP